MGEGDSGGIIAPRAAALGPSGLLSSLYLGTGRSCHGVHIVADAPQLHRIVESPMARRSLPVQIFRKQPEKVQRKCDLGLMGPCEHPPDWFKCCRNAENDKISLKLWRLWEKCRPLPNGLRCLAVAGLASHRCPQRCGHHVQRSAYTALDAIFLSTRIKETTSTEDIYGSKHHCSCYLWRAPPSTGAPGCAPCEAKSYGVTWPMQISRFDKICWRREDLERRLGERLKLLGLWLRCLS